MRHHLDYAPPTITEPRRKAVYFAMHLGLTLLPFTASLLPRDQTTMIVAMPVFLSLGTAVSFLIRKYSPYKRWGSLLFWLYAVAFAWLVTGHTIANFRRALMG